MGSYAWSNEFADTLMDGVRRAVYAGGGDSKIRLDSATSSTAEGAGTNGGSSIDEHGQDFEQVSDGKDGRERVPWFVLCQKMNRDRAVMIAKSKRKQDAELLRQKTVSARMLRLSIFKTASSSSKATLRFTFRAWWKVVKRSRSLLHSKKFRRKRLYIWFHGLVSVTGGASRQIRVENSFRHPTKRLRHRTSKRRRIASAFRIKRLEKREQNLEKQVQHLHEEKNALFARLEERKELSTLIERAHEGEPKCLVKILERLPYFDRLIKENRTAFEEISLELHANGGVESLALRIFSPGLGEKLMRAWPKLKSAEDALNESEVWFERAIGPFLTCVCGLRPPPHPPPPPYLLTQYYLLPETDAVELPASLERMGRPSDYAERRKASLLAKRTEVAGLGGSTEGQLPVQATAGLEAGAMGEQIDEEGKVEVDAVQEGEQQAEAHVEADREEQEGAGGEREAQGERDEDANSKDDDEAVGKIVKGKAEAGVMPKEVRESAGEASVEGTEGGAKRKDGEEHETQPWQDTEAQANSGKVVETKENP